MFELDLAADAGIDGADNAKLIHEDLFEDEEPILADVDDTIHSVDNTEDDTDDFNFLQDDENARSAECLEAESYFEWAGFRGFTPDVLDDAVTILNEDSLDRDSSPTSSDSCDFLSNHRFAPTDAEHVMKELDFDSDLDLGYSVNGFYCASELYLEYDDESGQAA